MSSTTDRFLWLCTFCLFPTRLVSIGDFFREIPLKYCITATVLIHAKCLGFAQQHGFDWCKAKFVVSPSDAVLIDAAILYGKWHRVIFHSCATLDLFRRLVPGMYSQKWGSLLVLLSKLSSSTLHFNTYLWLEIYASSWLRVGPYSEKLWFWAWKSVLPEASPRATFSSPSSQLFHYTDWVALERILFVFPKTWSNLWLFLMWPLRTNIEKIRH